MVDSHHAEIFCRKAVELASAQHADHPERVRLASDEVYDALRWPPEAHRHFHNDADDIVKYLRDAGKLIILGTTSGIVPFRMRHVFHVTRWGLLQTH